MRRDLVGWMFALAIFVALTVAFVERAFAYTAKELLGERDVAINCNKETRICTVSQDDLEWILGRTALLTKIAEQNAQQLKNCGVKGV